jgi:hypothetical protein
VIGCNVSCEARRASDRHCQLGHGTAIGFAARGIGDEEESGGNRPPRQQWGDALGGCRSCGCSVVRPS